MSFNPKEQDLHLGAMGVHVPYFDNVSSFSADGSDALCRMSTGGGSGSRKLYTDNQYNQVVVIRPIIVTCIGTPTSRPDLLSRSVRITALSLAGKRRTERAVMREFEADRPRMIGFLLSCVSLAIRNRQDVEDAVERGDFELPRMADFAEFVEGAAEKLGLKLGDFSALLGEGQSAMQTEAVLGHPVGAGLMEYFSHRSATVLDAPAREIIARLRDLLPHERYWPAPNTLRKALSRLSVGLQALGIEWEVSGPEGHDNVAKFRIRMNQPGMLALCSGQILGQTRARISMGRLREVVVPFPPLPLQTAFAGQASRLDAIAVHLDAAAATAEAMAAAVSAKVFG